ncbi:MAG: amidohydrolase [Acidimicrobiales bacterium]|nr:amidohydrolase [Acidimicrobiales bacterium]
MSGLLGGPGVPGIVSVDDHVIEPPHVWETYLSAKYQARGPRVELLPEADQRYAFGSAEHPGSNGPRVAWWHFEDKYAQIRRGYVEAGLSPDMRADMARGLTFDQLRPGIWQPQARVADNLLNGVVASLCFPNYPRFCGQLFSEAEDLDLGLACIRAYNDWMVEEWCGDSHGRLIPLCIVPLWDAGLAAEEVMRNAHRGVRAVAFSEIPAYLGVPSVHSGFWDPFFAACEETNTVVCMHVGSGTKTTTTSPDAPEAVVSGLIFVNSAGSMLDFLTSGVMARYPRLKLLYAEAQMGWLPYILDRLDDKFRRQPARFRGILDQPPSTYYAGRIFCCFYRDPVGVELLHRIGVDQVCFETDYPHGDSTWPHSPAVAAEQLAPLAEDERDRILRQNAIDLLELDPAGWAPVR